MRNKLKICILLFAVHICVIVPMRGQYLHTIIFADTNDKNIGSSVLQDYYSISVEANTIAAATGMQMKSYYFKGDQCSNQNLRTLLDQLRTSKDDVILFYYTGHGARSTQDTSEFPQMCLGSHYDSDFYPLEKVKKQLDSQPARLKIVIGDCCNSFHPLVTAKDYETKNVTVLSKEPVNVYNNLFTNNQGYLITSGSRKGETSAGYPDGGAFTNSLLGVLKNVAAQGTSATWEDIMSQTQQKTYARAQHTPVYTIKVGKDSATAPVTYQEPQNTATAPSNYQGSQNTTNSSDDDDIDKITILTAIGNENISVEKRVNIQDKALEALFESPNTKVEVVGSNGTTIVATEKASDFVLRLCTAHKLIRLAEVDCGLDQYGRYTYLKVHEIYKK